MRYPEFIKKGDTIGFVSPAFGCATEPYKSAFENAKRKLGERGYRADVGPNCGRTDGIGISGTPESCGREFMDYYLSGANKALISCGGGELMCTVLDYIDFEALSNAAPKWFMGYSDNTNITFLLATLCDTASVYGPCAAAFGMEPWHPAIEDALSVLEGSVNTLKGYGGWERESLKTGENPLVPYNITEKPSFKLFDKDGQAVVQSAQADNRQNTHIQMSGRLIGGCLDCLNNLAGTKYDRTAEFADRYKEDGLIWFLEACDLNVLSINRAMWHLDRSGWFEHVKGFIIGRPYCYGQSIMGLDQYEAVLGIIRKYNVPVIMDADIGHLPPMLPLVCGSMAEVSANGNGISIRMNFLN